MKLVRTASLLALVCGCAIPPSGPWFAAGEPTMASPSTMCPLGFRGTRVTIDDTAAGADVSLEGFGDIGELRRRARDAAAMYGPGAHKGLGHDGGKHGDGKGHGLALGQLGVKVRATEQDTNEGATIHVAPVDARDRVAMLDKLHARVDRARTGDCH